MEIPGAGESAGATPALRCLVVELETLRWMRDPEVKRGPLRSSVFSVEGSLVLPGLLFTLKRW